MASLNQTRYDNCCRKKRNRKQYLLNKPVLFWGESLFGGALDDNNLPLALESNFGDSKVLKKVNYGEDC
jgi:hypothetical protein